MEIRSKKLLINRSEIADLTKTLQAMQAEMRNENDKMSSRLDTIEHHINKLRKTRHQSKPQDCYNLL